ncbi:LptF/LptG family permease, partial [Vibrio sp. FNV 38]|nr:LptF/LptG family permease [Vibrio sp. FNV 38]
MCFGNLGEHYELVAMKASGISMWRAMRPLFNFALILSVLAFFISNSLIPIATLKWRTLLTDIQRQKLAFNIKEGVFYKDIENYVIFVDRKGKDGSHIYGVKIYDHTDHNGCTKVIAADSGMMSMSPNQRSIIFTLY